MAEESSSENGFMQIFVKPFSKTITLTVKPSYTIGHVKAIITDIYTGLEPSIQRLIYRNEYLEDDKTLADYNVENLSTFQFSMRMSGS